MRDIRIINFKNRPGFTLIEILIYLALFTILIGGTMVVAYQIFENSGSLQAKAIIQEDGNFILAKIAWPITGSAVDTIVSIPNSSTLRIVKTGSVLQFDLNNNNIRLERNDSGTNLELNSDRVKVSSLVFSQPVSGEIKTDITLTMVSDQGKPLSQSFEMIKYLK